MTTGDGSLLEGLYESLITRALEKRLAGITKLDIHRGPIDEADEPDVLARHVRDVTLRALREEKNAERRLALVNQLVEMLGASEDSLSAARQLLAIAVPPAPGGHLRLLSERPSTPLSEAALLTNAAGEPGLGHEIRAELASADRVDLIMAFVKWYGLRLLEDRLEALRERGVPLRIITTTYMGATDRAALDRLVRDFGAEVKIQFDSQRTRLHAKSWLFRRNTGFDTAYVGSSNLSRAAMLDGVEWNVRLSAISTPALLRKFRATFDSYWNDPTFETYDPDADRDRLDDALAEAAGKRPHDRVTLTLSGLEVRPYAYQQEMLDQLDVERLVHDRHRNLVVAATGTGKTVVAALDYSRLAAGSATLPRLLFVAHRREILQQSLRTYREVLSDAGFGELYVDGHRPERWDHVFASVQSLSSYGITNIPPDAYDVVVVDEFHHAEARTYRRILDHLQPRELLGLTATPERGDGLDVRSFFEGRTAAELRLWDALKADLLTPFHYFAVADGMDMTRVDWKAGAYDAAELSNLFTGNDARARIVLKAVRDKVADLTAMKALAFCVSRDHARYMTRVFNEAGIRAAVVLGDTTKPERDDAVRDLRDGAIQVLFAVDVFNEGVDVPAINTVLFLRPTESSTVFLQQLGRGLRRATDKAVLTALDFVGHHRKEFRFDQRFRAMTGSTRAALERDIQHGFPFLPAGTQIVLDRQSQELVLENIRSQVTTRWTGITAELRAHPTDDLTTFLDESGVELADVVRDGPLLGAPAPRRRARGPAGRTLRAGAPQAGARPMPHRRLRPRGRLPDLARRRRARLRPGGPRPPGLRSDAVLLPLAGRRRFRVVLRRTECPSGRGRCASGHAGGHRDRSRLRGTRDTTAARANSACARSRFTLGTPVRRSSLPWTTSSIEGRKPNSFQARASCSPPRPTRTLPRDPAQVRGRLLADHDVPGLRDQPRALPLGVAVGDHGGVADRVSGT